MKTPIDIKKKISEEALKKCPITAEYNDFVGSEYDSNSLKRAMFEEGAEYGYKLGISIKNKLKNISKNILEKLFSSEKDEWISVKNSLPPKYKPVLLYFKMEALSVQQGNLMITDNGITKFAIANNFQFNIDEVTHWMPLPNPPKN